MKSKKWTIALFLFYLLVLAAFILFKTRLSFSFLHIRFSFASSNLERSINLIPFGAMLILNGAPSYSEIALNVLAFVPFGIFLGMLKSKASFARLMMPILLTSLLFEVIQYILAIGISDITDVIANTLGGLAGIGIFAVFHKMCKENIYKAMNIAALVFLIALVLLIAVSRPVLHLQ